MEKEMRAAACLHDSADILSFPPLLNRPIPISCASLCSPGLPGQAEQEAVPDCGCGPCSEG